MAIDRGAPVPPPSDLAGRVLALRSLAPAGWWRIHDARREPCFYSENPSNRFSSAGFGVLYLADSAVTAFWEIFWDDLGTRPEGERRIGLAKLNQKVVRGALLKRPLRVFDATDARTLKSISASTGTFSGDYANCQLWGRELFAHGSAPDGILYPSARHGRGVCLALFAARTACDQVDFDDATPVGESADILASVLDNHVDVLPD